MVNGDTLSRFGGNKDLVGSLGFLASPGKLGHSALGRDDLGNFIWDFTIEGELLELGKCQAAKPVVQTHEFSLIVDGCKLDVFSFLCWR